MKRLFTIALLVLLLLNILGYYGVFLGLQYSNDEAFNRRLDNERYRAEETITFKVPLAVPYHIDDTEFSRVEGVIENNGQMYRLVKQKLAHDTLYIVCIADHQQSKIKRALSDYVKTFADQPVKKSNGKTIPSFIKDYILSDSAVKPANVGWNYSIGFSIGDDKLPTSSSEIPSPPPKS